MSWPVKNATPCEEQIRTISSVISAICLVVIAVGLVSAGVYTVNIVHTLEHNHELRSLEALKHSKFHVFRETSEKHIKLRDPAAQRR